MTKTVLNLILKLMDQRHSVTPKHKEHEENNKANYDQIVQNL